MSVNHDDDLVTDALPSKPRDKIPDHVKVNDSNMEETSPRNSESCNVKYNPRKKKSKQTEIYPNVINISNSKGIHIGNSCTFNLNKNEVNDEPKTSDYKLTEEIQLMMNSNEPATKEHITIVSTHIGQGWRFFVRRLDFSDGQIDQFYEKNIVYGINEVIYQILLDWIRNSEDATMGKMSSLLWNTNQKDAVFKLLETK